jgi:hypothetical protein
MWRAAEAQKEIARVMHKLVYDPKCEYEEEADIE